MSDISSILNAYEITKLAKERFKEERSINRLDGWFLAKEIQRVCDEEYKHLPDSIRTARTQIRIAEELPLQISDHSIFAGTQNDAFARSYALINPAFSVDRFKGYCDPVAVFDDIEPNDDITVERIQSLKEYNEQSAFAKALKKADELAEGMTGEVIFFFEQVSGHLIPDVRYMLSVGIDRIQSELDEKILNEQSEAKRTYFEAMKLSLDAALVYAARYSKLALEKSKQATVKKDKKRFEYMSEVLKNVPGKGARNLFEAIQAFLIIWQTMCMEQAPNPYAFSVGNADRIFGKYQEMENTEREIAAAYFKHMLVFFNVADRSWAISQNLMVGGKDVGGADMTSPTSYALLDAYYDMNLPQPILSTKLHSNTPEELYRSMGRFFFTPGCLTPSLFNDDSLFEILKNKGGIESEDLPDYSIAGCQEPLIMGKENANTTNSWLNLAKILELSLNDGISLITGKRYGKSDRDHGYNSKLEVLRNIRELFYKNAEVYIGKMVSAANAASEALSLLQVPFLSTMMGGLETGVDVRDAKRQGSKYNASGCLIHGLSVVADSFAAIDNLLKDRPEDADRLIEALKTDFEYDESLHQYLLTAPKFGNNIATVDNEAAEIARKISEMVSKQKNYLGQPFKPDWSSPSTHLLYGYWVGATPDGRHARQELNYGVDPLFGDATQGLGMRLLSNMKIPFEEFTGGYASHIGVNPVYFKGGSYEEMGIEFRDKIISPLFYNPLNKNRTAPFYLYVNVTTPETLRAVLNEPKKYAPSGVYIMRIHGTFVNFLDLSRDIQEDIIARLDLESTAL